MIIYASYKRFANRLYNTVIQLAWRLCLLPLVGITMLAIEAIAS